MNPRKTTLYLVTVRTLSSVFQDIVEAQSLFAAACAGVAEHCGPGAEPHTWDSEPSRSINAARLLSLKSSRDSAQVIAETLIA